MNENITSGSAPSKKDLRFASLIPSIIVVLVSALAIPLASNIYVSSAAAFVCAVFLIATAKKKVPAALLILLLIGSFGLPSGLPMISVILALITGTGTLSWLIYYTSSPYLAIIPVLAYSAATIITKNWFASLLSLVFALPALMLAVSFKKKLGRISSICSSSVTFAVIAAAGVILSLLYFNGEIRVSVLKEFALSCTDSVKTLLAETEVELMDGSIQTLFDEKDAYNMAHQLVTLFPALAVIAINIISFFAQRLQFSLIRSTIGDEALGGRSLAFIASPGSGIVFTLSLIVIAITDSTPAGTMADTVCLNIFLILLPTLVGMGILYFIAKLSERRMRFGPFIIMAVLALSFFNFTLALLLIACFGSYASVAIPLTAYLRSRNKDD